MIGPGRVWLRWGGSAAFAVLDQGFFACSGFLVNIMLARWLSPESFGAFAVGYSVFFFLGTLYTQTLISPMLVFGAGKYATGFRAYLGLLGYGHLGIATAVSLVLAGGAAVVLRFGSPAIATTLLGFAIAAPFILWLWLARAAFYVRFQSQWAALGSVLYLLMVAAGLYGLYRLHRLSPMSAPLVMGFSSLVMGALLTLMLAPQWRSLGSVFRRPGFGRLARLEHLTTSGRPAGDPGDRKQTGQDAGTVVHDHLQYARWASAASATGWLVNNLHYFVLSSTAGLGSVAVMRVLDTALSPYFNFQVALSRVLLPVLGARAKAPTAGLLPFVFRLSILWGLQGVIAYLIVRAFAPKVISLLYGGAYSQYGSLLGWYGLIMIPTAIGDPLLSLLRALVRTDLVFLYQLLFSATLFLGYLAAAGHGLSGIILVLIVANYGFVPVAVLCAKAVCSSRIVANASVPDMAG